MKKRILLGALVVAMGLGMTSCETKTVIDEGVNWKIYDCKVLDYDWQYSYDTDHRYLQYDNNYYYAGFETPMLSSTVFNDGKVQAYLIETNESGEEIQRTLPYSRHKESFEQTEQGEQRFFYTETYDCVYGIGWVQFEYRVSDFAYEDSNGRDIKFRPLPCKFRVVLTW